MLQEGGVVTYKVLQVIYRYMYIMCILRFVINVPYILVLYII